MPDRNTSNILFIHTDSMDGRLMGCMGHPAMANATPTLDALAREGVLFCNAYRNNFKGLKDSDDVFTDRLQSAGYTCLDLGKTDYRSGGHTIRARVSPWTRSANIPRPNYRMGSPEVLENCDERVHNNDWRKVDQATKWLRDETPDLDNPFYLYIGLGAPHPRFTTSQHYLDMIPEEAVDLPPVDASLHPSLAYQRCNKNWLHGFSDETVRLVRRIYFAMIAEVDAMVRTVIAELDHLGLRDNTYVIFSSDHGEQAMEHRQFYKMSPYEASTHIPLIITGPNVRQNHDEQALVSLVDLYPTFMDISNTPHPDGLDGYSLMPELTGGSPVRPDWVLSEFFGTSVNTGVFMLRQDDWKYIAYAGTDPQLFNLKEDPHEINNRAKSQADRVKDMDALLRSIVDYDAVDAKVKAYDKEAFAAWRQEELEAGTYRETMAKIFSGWDDLSPESIRPWKDHDERQIETWLAE
jgi:arylsulfatase K